MPLNINFQQVLLHLLNFVILFAGLYFLLYKPVTDFMQKREDQYRSMDEQARSNLDASEKSKAEYETKLSEAESEIRKMKEQARNDIYNERMTRLKQADKEADEIIDRARADARAEYNRIINDSQKEIEAIAYKAAKKVMYRPDSSSFDQFLEAAEAEDAAAAAVEEVRSTMLPKKE